MLDVYREIDFQIGRLLAALDLSDTTFILFSMHGMKAGYAQDHFLPDVMERVNHLYLKKLGHDAPPPSKGGLARMLRQTVPASVQLQIREMVGQTVQDWLVDREWRGGKDWKTTPAFPVPGGGDVGFIRLNVQGRERDGFLPAGDGVENYLDFLCTQLKALRVTQTNEPLIDEIVLSRDAFPGSYNYLLPDVFLTWHPEAPATEISSPDLGTIQQRSRRAEEEPTPVRASRSSPEPARQAGFPLFPTSAITSPTCNGSLLRHDALTGASRSAAFAAAVRRTKPLPRKSGYQPDKPVEKRQSKRIARRHAGKAEGLDKDDFPDAPPRKRNRHHGEQQCCRDKRERIERGNRDAKSQPPGQRQ